VTRSVGAEHTARDFAVEYEVRYLVASPDPVRARIEELNGSLASVEEVSDQWFVPKFVNTYEDHENWLLRSDANPLRIRTVLSEGGLSCRMEVKRPVVAGSFNRSEELSLTIADGRAGALLLECLGRHRICTLTKTRSIHDLSSGFRCCLDEYENDVCICELESTRGGDEQEQAGALRELASSLGLDARAELGVSTAIFLIRKHLAGQLSPGQRPEDRAD